MTHRNCRRLAGGSGSGGEASLEPAKADWRHHQRCDAPQLESGLRSVLGLRAATNRAGLQYVSLQQGSCGSGFT